MIFGSLESIVESRVTALLVWPSTILCLLLYECSRLAPSLVRGRRLYAVLCVPLVMIFIAVVVARFVLLKD